MATIDAQSGRAAAIARRLAMSAGKAALPAASERVRDGQRSASTPAVAGSSPAVSVTRPVAASPPPSMPAATPSRIAASGLTGRDASLERRRLLSAGKGAVGASPQPPMADLSALAASLPARDVSRARRIALSQLTSADTESATPSSGALVPVTRAVDSVMAGQRVTSSRIGRGQSVTGGERGTTQPVSGTQYVVVGDTASSRAAGPKVGFSKTSGGLTVSGSMVRSAVAVTGDEAGAASVTGRVDQSPADDLTTRSQGGGVPTQFPRPTSSGAGAFGGSGSSGSRERRRERLAETTENGVAITGTAFGKSSKVTGDQGGATRNVTGNQFMGPVRRQAAPGQPVPQAAEPVVGRKLSVAQSWGGQSVSGLDVEQNKRVTGDEAGSTASLTGSQYLAPAALGAQGGAETATSRRMAARTSKGVTGNTAMHAEGVTGTARGAGRDVTGTAYYRTEAEPAAASANPVAELDNRFSIRTPQRSAQLSPPRHTEEDRITGSFAAGGGKLTGNVEFQMRRRAAEADRAGASTQVSGEGSGKGTAITGNAWSNKGRVTGVDGSFASARNPTERGPKAKPFAGATTFKTEAKTQETSQLVTGSFSKTGARVTLSGGAQT